MISAFAILFGAGLISPLLYRNSLLKPLAIVVALFATLFGLFSEPWILSGFATNEAVKLFGVVLLVVTVATLLHIEDDITITQTLFLSSASIALIHSNNLISFIISFETLSLISIVLVTNFKTEQEAEGAIKIFLAGAVATALLLLGVTLYLMGGGSLDNAIGSNLNNIQSIGLYIAMLAIFYKLTIVPMHNWAVDTYSKVLPQRASLLSAVAKTAVAIASFKLFYPMLIESPHRVILAIAILAIVTMTLGNFLALFQKQISKILAYSSIAHAGYMLLAFAAVASPYASTGILYMAIAYIFMQSGVFLALWILKSKYNISTLEDLKGLYSYSPTLSLIFTIQLFSLSGIPLLAGFMGKVVVFYAGVDAGLWIFVLIALLNSALSVGYYAWIIKHIYFDKTSKEQNIRLNRAYIVGQIILLIGTIYYGVFASEIFQVGVVL